MTKNWVAVLSALVVAGASYAGGTDVKDKTAPTSFATVGCTTPPVVHAPCTQCCEGCNDRHHCLGKLKDWLCFTPIRTCPCECPHACASYPPLYLYFMRPCVEGPGCTHYASHCDSCVSCAKSRNVSCGGCCGQAPAAGCGSCTTCK
jgi:hypothetical protein